MFLAEENYFPFSASPAFSWGLDDSFLKGCVRYPTHPLSPMGKGQEEDGRHNKACGNCWEASLYGKPPNSKKNHRFRMITAEAPVSCPTKPTEQ
jgi:hypothetical protein